jgi:putative ABC transport system substrate-binding protein
VNCRLPRIAAHILLATAIAIAGRDAQAQVFGNVPLVAILEPGPAARPSPGLARFKEELGRLGWVEGRTVRFETRYGDWRPDRTVAMARELVGLKPDLLYTHSDGAARVAMQVTSDIPIVVGMSGNLPAVTGVKSIAQPGGNVTGMSSSQPDVEHKRLEVLKETVSSVAHIGYLYDAKAVPEATLRGLESSAQRLGVRLSRFGLSSPEEIEQAFAAMVNERVQAVLVQDTVMISRYSDRVATVAIKHRLPTISQIPAFAERGGLLQYGADVYDLFRRSAIHVDKILKGAKPGDIPIEQPTKIDMIINLKTAKAIGLTIPPAMLIRADRVIQ